MEFVDKSESKNNFVSNDNHNDSNTYDNNISISNACIKKLKLYQKKGLNSVWIGTQLEKLS